MWPATFYHLGTIVQVAGSSIVLPGTSIMSEASCEGVDGSTIDIANVSRPIQEKEIKGCAESGVTDIIEVLIGYDGIVFTSQIDDLAYIAFTPSYIFNTLTLKVIVDGAFVPAFGVPSNFATQNEASRGQVNFSKSAF